MQGRLKKARLLFHEPFVFCRSEERTGRIMGYGKKEQR